MAFLLWHVCICVCAVSENVGVRLWWQQYYGLLLKKTLDTVRFWQVFASIYLIPILTSLLGLLLFHFLANFTLPDPARELGVANSAIDPDNRILFWAKFGDFANNFDFEVCSVCLRAKCCWRSFLSFSSSLFLSPLSTSLSLTLTHTLTLSTSSQLSTLHYLSLSLSLSLFTQSLGTADVGATQFMNITESVAEIMDSVQSISNVSDCCNYQYQILDKFCVLRSAVSTSQCVYNQQRGYMRILAFVKTKDCNTYILFVLLFSG